MVLLLISGYFSLYIDDVILYCFIDLDIILSIFERYLNNFLDWNFDFLFNDFFNFLLDNLLNDDFLFDDFFLVDWSLYFLYNRYLYNIFSILYVLLICEDFLFDFKIIFSLYVFDDRMLVDFFDWNLKFLMDDDVLNVFN